MSNDKEIEELAKFLISKGLVHVLDNIGRLSQMIIEEGYRKQRLEPLSVKSVAQEMYELCCYPDPTPWESIDKSVWMYRAGIFCDKFGTPKQELVNKDEQSIIPEAVEISKNMKDWLSIPTVPLNDIQKRMVHSWADAILRIRPLYIKTKTVNVMELVNTLELCKRYFGERINSTIDNNILLEKCEQSLSDLKIP